MPDDAIIVALPRPHAAAGSGQYELPVYPFVEPAELRGSLGRHPVAIVGAGLTGLTLACDLALRGIPAVVLDEDDTVGARGAASRAICYAQKSLEIFRRLGIGERMRSAGIEWSVSRTYSGSEEIGRIDFETLPAHRASEQAAFLNLQQFYVEWFLVDRLYELGTVELRWKNRVTGIEQRDEEVVLEVDTPAGSYRVAAAWVVDCSGARSALRGWTGTSAVGDDGLERWFAADVRLHRPPIAERRAWIEAPFNDGRAAWQQPMADGVCRFDYQMPSDSGMEASSGPEWIAQRLRRQFGQDVRFDLVWHGQHACRSECLNRFRAGRVLFAGDAAHVMSPLGSRGGNSGVQDADNLGWKLAFVLAHGLPARLLDSYDQERRAVALRNIEITRRSTRFVAPRTEAERLWRQAVLGLARRYPFAREWVDTGRLSMPADYADSMLNAGARGGGSIPNVELLLPDGRLGDLVGLLEQAEGRLLGLFFGRVLRDHEARLDEFQLRYPVRFFAVRRGGKEVLGRPSVLDADGRLARQFGVADGHLALLRPDLHLAGIVAVDAAEVERALRSVLALEA